MMLWTLETLNQTSKQNLSWVFCEPLAGLSSSQWQDNASEPLPLGASDNKSRTWKSIAQNWDSISDGIFFFFFFNLAKTVWEPEAQFLSGRWIIVVDKDILIWNELRVFDSSELQHWITILFSPVTFLMHLTIEIVSVFWDTLKSELRLKQSTSLMHSFH